MSLVAKLNRERLDDLRRGHRADLSAVKLQRRKSSNLWMHAVLSSKETRPSLSMRSKIEICRPVSTASRETWSR